jgi:hypothetical protein
MSNDNFNNIFSGAGDNTDAVDGGDGSKSHMSKRKLVIGLIKAI